MFACFCRIFHALTIMFVLMGCGRIMKNNSEDTEGETKSVDSGRASDGIGHTDIMKELGVEWEEYVLERLKKLETVEHSIPEEEVRKIGILQETIGEAFQKLRDSVKKCEQTEMLDCDSNEIKTLKRQIEKAEKEIQIIISSNRSNRK